MAKEILRWEYKSEGQAIEAASDYPKKYEKEAQFSFKLTRYKDEVTHEETLEIESFIEEKKGDKSEKKENGKIITSIASLDKDFAKFRRYGVVLSPIQMADLKREIESNYLNLEPVPGNLFPIEEAVEIIKENMDEQAPVWEIPVTDFNSWYEHDEIFANFDITQIRSNLARHGYIEGENGGRTSKTKRIDGKPTRIVTICKAKFEGIPEE